MAGDRRRLRGAERRPLKGYAPLVVLVAAFVVMVAIVPSKVPAELASIGQGTATEVAAGQPATGWGDTVTACPDRPLQVPTSGTRRRASRSPATTAATPPGRHRRHDQGHLPPHARPEPARACSAARRRRPSTRPTRTSGAPPRPRRLLQRQLPVLRPQDRADRLDGRGQLLPGVHSAAARTPPTTTPSRWPTSSARSPTSPASPSPTPTPWPATGSSASGRRTCRASGSTSAGPTRGAHFPDCTVVGRDGGASTPTSGCSGSRAELRRRRPRRASPASSRSSPPTTPSTSSASTRRASGIDDAGNEIDLRLDYMLDLASCRPRRPA